MASEVYCNVKLSWQRTLILESGCVLNESGVEIFIADLREIIQSSKEYSSKMASIREGKYDLVLFCLIYFLIHFCAERNLSILDRYSVEFYFLIECSFCFFSIGEIKQASQEKVNLTFAHFVSSLIRLFNSFTLFVFPQDLSENQVSKSLTFLALKDAEVRK